MLFISRRSFSVGDKYLIFLSESQFSDSYAGVVTRNGSERERYFDHGKDWFDACVSRLDRENSDVYTAWLGTGFRFTDVRFETNESWLHFLPGQLMFVRDQVEIQPERVNACIGVVNDDDCWLSSHREVVSEVSIRRWIIESVGSETIERLQTM